MKKLSVFALILGCSMGLLSLCSCSDASYITPEMTFAYEDFGTDAIASRLLGPRGKDMQIVVRFGTTRTTPKPGGPDLRFVSTQQAMHFLRSNVHKLPKTPENAELRKRLQATYSRLYDVYSSKRSSFLSAPSSSYGRDGMNRALMMPPMPPSI
ncbi:MAG: hypothetical protein K9N47_01265 [Prosthecobacter sp.]|uniref:hypothetical protein n=1 Tax=Prosthecobacter sp. TaxID=1965333 RepID=UPI0025EC2520|nr:hypothetical protein [Prosthecobacter sp.]MCF7784715.1 hypothetical protein [Prosthecobacter sp.]